MPTALRRLRLPRVSWSLITISVFLLANLGPAANAPVAQAAPGAAPLPAAAASPVAAPASVTIVGDLQSELGCPGDWQPDCAATHLTYDAGDDVWQGTFTVPAGAWQYKAALNDSWAENYGLHAAPGGDNIPLNLGAPTSVKFYYDDKSHWVTDNQGSVIATVAGRLPVRAGLPGRLGPRLPALVAARPGWRRHLSLRNHQPPGRLIPGQGGPQRKLGCELWPGRRPKRRQHRLYRPRQWGQGHLHLRLQLACVDHPGRPRPRQQRGMERPGATTRATRCIGRRAAPCQPAPR